MRNIARTGRISRTAALLTILAVAAFAPAHAGARAISALAFSPDGRDIAIGGYGSVSTRSVAGAVSTSRRLVGISGAITALAYSPDGKLLAAAGGLAGRSGEVDVWDVVLGTMVMRLKGPMDVVDSIAWRPGKREIAGGSYDKVVYLWRLPAASRLPQNVRPYRSLRDHTDAVYSVDFSPDGLRVASASGDRTVKIWNVESGKRLITLSESTGELYTAAFRPDGAQVAAAGVDRIIRVWNPTNGELIKSGFAHDGAILLIRYTLDSKSLISCGQDKAVKQWSADSLADIRDFPLQSEWPQALALSRDRIAVGSQDGRLSQYALAATPKTIGAVNETNGTRSATGLTRIRQTSPIGFVNPSHKDRANHADPIVSRVPGNESLEHAQVVSIPVTVSGELWDRKPGEAEVSGANSSDGISHFYRFTARRNVPLVIDVIARRAGSRLDSFIQVLDTKGAPVEQAVLRAVGQSEITLFDKDSAITGIRLLPFPDLHLNDYVLIGRELLRVGTLPKGPDDDTQFRSIHGQRAGWLGTNPEFHSIGAKVYRVEVHPAGSTFSPNGMPLTHVMYENDDGGPLYGRDSYLMFLPPSDGDYIVRLTDSGGQQGKDFTYKLNIHAPRPDYKVSSSPSTVTIPKGGREALTVECDRFEGFSGPIHVKIDGLPDGFSSTETDIESGENNAVLLVTAGSTAVGSTATAPISFRVVCTAEIDNHAVERILQPDPVARKLAIGAPAGVQADVDTHEVSIAPGGTAAVVAAIVRTKGFAGRVPIEVRNLPFGVKVMDIGLNGILVNETETTRRIVFSCEPWVSSQDRSIYLFAGVEGGVGTAAPPIVLHIRPDSPH